MNTANPAIEMIIARIKGVYGGWRRDTPVAQMRADWDALFWRDDIAATSVAVDADGVECRWISTPNARADRTLIYFHGGGFTMGSVRSHHDLMVRLSEASGCRVLGVNYLLLPEAAFPAPLEDALTVYRWVLAQGCEPAHLAVAGDSAGGGLAAALLLALRDQQIPLPAAGVLLSAWLDLEANAESYSTRAAADPIHQKPMILALARRYLGPDGNARDPRASPLHGALHGLPPLLLQTGDRETGRDDSTDFANKARAAGVAVEVEVWDGMIHVFQQFAAELPEARKAIEHIAIFLRKQLA